MNLKAFRRDVNRKLEELQRDHPSGYVYLTSLHDSQRQQIAGVVTEVSLPNAARHLCERSAELSTPQEIEGYRQKCEETRATISAASKRHLDKELRISVDR
jgi:hypothetical protein